MSQLASVRSSLALLMLGIAAVGIQALMLSPLLTDIAATLRAGPREIGLAAGAYGGAVAVSAFLAAPRLGRWPKRPAIQLAFAVMAVGLGLCALAWDWRVLALGQALSGLAAGVIIPGSYALTTDIVAPGLRSQALGRVIFGWSTALVLGVPLAAVLADWADWRGTFVAVAALAALMVGALARLPTGSSAGPAAGAGASYRQALSQPGIAIGYLATFAFMIGFYQTYTFIGDHVRALHGAGAWLGGLIACFYGAGFGAGVVFDKWIDRVGPRRVVAGALVLVGLNYVILPFAALSPWTVVGFALVWGLVQHLGMNSLVSLMGTAPPGNRATVMGLFSAVTYLAQGAGGAAYGGVYDAHGFMAVCFAATVTAWGAALLFALLGSRRPSQP